ncbi:adenosylmethionine decarboxylase [Saccharothrix xinjiangensis]|uniref:Adenosylmethionine decarboxylase n=1 Tax=Saccharothrix xinjiangensis TaxID=204798 RepID=A0ABV9YDD7_9PSEU
MSQYDFSGKHIMCDITGVAEDVVLDNTRILDSIALGITDSGATLCGVQLKEFEPIGLAAVYILSESHVSVHTYPELGALFFDVFTCGDHCVPERILDALLRALGPCEYRVSVVGRGDPVTSGTPARRST